MANTKFESLKKIQNIVNDIKKEDYDVVAKARKEAEEIRKGEMIITKIFSKIKALEGNIKEVIEAESVLERNSFDKAAIMKLKVNLKGARDRLNEIKNLEDELLAGSKTQRILTKRIESELDDYEDLIRDIEKRIDELAS